MVEITTPNNDGQKNSFRQEDLSRIESVSFFCPKFFCLVLFLCGFAPLREPLSLFDKRFHAKPQSKQRMMPMNADGPDPLVIFSFCCNRDQTCEFDA